MSKRTVTVNVTEDDIAQGEIGSCLSCPVALALTRVFLPGFAPSVRHRWVNVKDTGDYVTRMRIALPADVVAFIEDFDEFDEGEPFAFTLALPQEVLR